MERRIFIRNTGASSLLVGLGRLGSLSMKPNNVKHITILHINDTHSHVDPLPLNDPINPNKGGATCRAQLIGRIRKGNSSTLLFDAGNISQGTPYFDFHRGELEFKVMSMLRYGAATLGNRDFSNGLEGLHAQPPHVKFGLVISNYDVSNTILNGHIKPYKIYLVGSAKIGAFGIGIKLERLVTKQDYGEIVYPDPTEIAQDMERKLRNEEKRDLIICLSYIGYDYKDSPKKANDLKVVAQTSHIDLIIGGRTHTFLDRSTLVTNRSGNTILVNRVGCCSVSLECIDLCFEENTLVKNQSVSTEV